MTAPDTSLTAAAGAGTPEPSAEQLLQSLQTHGVLQAIDAQFGRLIARLEPSASAWVALAAALTSRAVQAGHVCLELSKLVQQPLLGKDERPVPLQLPALADWAQALTNSSLVSRSGVSEPLRPLVLDEKLRLFLHRYSAYQERLVSQLQSRLLPLTNVNESALRQGLEQAFGPPDPAQLDLQRLAALLAVRNRFSIISGGPGTGKTTTVAKILVLLQSQALAGGGPPLRVVLLAPTGKAAQRLSESLKQGLLKLNVSDAVLAEIPAEASTIHRALGYSQRTPTRFVHNAELPLPADVVLVDEASMVDLALMTKLVEAVPRTARLILLGDKDQLASVEAGAIFGDLFNAQGDHRYSQNFNQFAQRVGFSPLPERADVREAHIADCTVHLERSYRYAADSNIGKLAAALRDANGSALRAVLTSTAGAWLDTSTYTEPALEQALQAEVVESYRNYALATDAEARLKALHEYRVLCAHRRGFLGVEHLNTLTEQALAEHGLLSLDSRFYDGRPVMITENDYQLGLFNGDVGVVSAPRGRRPFVLFDSLTGLRSVQTSRLPAHETVFAMTVHKSQGSEFERVLLVLPSEPSPLVSRELLYTGLTRAKRDLSLVSSPEVLQHAIKTPIERSSGLRDALWGAPA